MTCCHAAALLLALSLWASSSAALAQTEEAAPEPDIVVEATEPGATPPADEPAPELGFDPALVGLPDLPLSPSTEEELDLALELISARIAELQALEEGQEAEAPEQQEGTPTPAAADPGRGPDPRIELLTDLRDAMLRGAAVAAHIAQLDDVIAEQQELLAAVERVPKIIEEIIRAQRNTRFDRAHFFEYGDFSLVFEVVYYVLGADYTLYMDIQQAINLAVYRRFAEAGIEFAYPTQELIVRQASPSGIATSGAAGPLKPG